MLRGMFGQPFLDTLNKTPTGQWIGPLQSTRGWHFARVRDQVKQDFLAEQSGALVEKEVQKLEDGYRVRVEQ